jgi:hypothetical protein
MAHVPSIGRALNASRNFFLIPDDGKYYLHI